MSHFPEKNAAQALTLGALANISDNLQDFGMHAPMSGPLDTVQAIDALNKLARSAQLLLAGRQMMTTLKSIFHRFPDLHFIEVDFFSGACDVDDGVPAYHDVNLEVLGVNKGCDAEAIESALLSEGFSPEVLRTLMGVADAQDGSLRVNLSRAMFSPGNDPADMVQVAIKAIFGLEQDILDGYQPSFPERVPQAATRAREKAA